MVSSLRKDWLPLLLVAIAGVAVTLPGIDAATRAEVAARRPQVLAPDSYAPHVPYADNAAAPNRLWRSAAQRSALEAAFALDLLRGMYAGAASGLLLYHLLLFWGTRERTHLQYVGAGALLVASERGLSALGGLPERTSMLATSALLVLLAVFGVLHMDRLRRGRADAQRRRERAALLEMRTRTREMGELRDLKRALLTRLVEAQEQERSRIARDLHDGLGQQLSALKNAVVVHPVASRDAAVLQDVSACIEATRGISRELHPHVLRHLGLRPALESVAARLCRDHDTAIEISVSEEAAAIAGERAIHLYRIVQESLDNALRHGKARFVEVDLSVTDSALELSVYDDGCGFSSGERPPRGGLLEVHARAEVLEGEIQIESDAEGTSLVVRIPRVTAADGMAGSDTGAAIERRSA